MLPFNHTMPNRIRFPLSCNPDGSSNPPIPIPEISYLDGKDPFQLGSDYLTVTPVYSGTDCQVQLGSQVATGA